MLLLVLIVAVVTAVSGQLPAKDDVLNEVNPAYVPDLGYGSDEEQPAGDREGGKTPAPTLDHDTDVNDGAEEADLEQSRDSTTADGAANASGVVKDGKKAQDGSSVDKPVLEEVVPHGQREGGDSDDESTALTEDDAPKDPCTTCSENGDYGESSLIFEDNEDKRRTGSKGDQERSNGFVEHKSSPSDFNTDQGSAAPNLNGGLPEDADSHEIPAIVLNVDPPNRPYYPTTPQSAPGLPGSFPGAPPLGTTRDENYSSLFQSYGEFGSTVQEMNIGHSVQHGPAPTRSPFQDVVTEHSVSTVHSTDGQSSYLEKTEVDQKFKQFPHPVTSYKTDQKKVPPGLPLVHIKPGKTPSKYPVEKYPYLMKNHLPISTLHPTKIPLFTPIGKQSPEHVDPSSPGEGFYQAPGFEYTPRGQFMHRETIDPRSPPLQKILLPQHPLAAEHPLADNDGYNYLAMTYFDHERYPGSYPVLHQPLLHHMDHADHFQDHVHPHMQTVDHHHPPSGYLPGHPYLGIPVVARSHPYAHPMYPGRQAFWIPAPRQRPLLF